MSQENVEIVRAGDRRRSMRGDVDGSRELLDTEMSSCWSRWPGLEHGATDGIDGSASTDIGDIGAWSVRIEPSRSTSTRWRSRRDRLHAVQRDGRASGIDDRARRRSSSRFATARSVDPHLPRPRRSPQSRGAGGVGDVAGERGDRAASLEAPAERDLEGLRDCSTGCRVRLISVGPVPSTASTRARRRLRTFCEHWKRLRRLLESRGLIELGDDVSSPRARCVRGDGQLSKSP